MRKMSQQIQNINSELKNTFKESTKNSVVKKTQ